MSWTKQQYIESLEPFYTEGQNDCRAVEPAEWIICWHYAKVDVFQQFNPQSRVSCIIRGWLGIYRDKETSHNYWWYIVIHIHKIVL